MLDATAAYLQGDEIDRTLILKLPNPPPPGVPEDAVLLCLSSIYGTKDAGRKWWSKLRRTLIELGWRESRLERALCLLLVIDGANMRLIGVFCTHVDDIFAAGDENEAKDTDSMHTLEVRLHIKTAKPPFRYCGKGVSEDEDGTVRISMKETAEALEEVTVPAPRRKETTSPLTIEEKSEYRSVNGSIGWLSRQLRGDLSFGYSILAQKVNDACVSDLLDLNRVVREAHEASNAEFVCKAGTCLDHGYLTVFVFVDSSLQNVDDEDVGEKVRSQAGYVIGICDGEMMKNGGSPIHILEWSSSRIEMCAGERCPLRRMASSKVLRPAIGERWRSFDSAGSRCNCFAGSHPPRSPRQGGRETQGGLQSCT